MLTCEEQKHQRLAQLCRISFHRDAEWPGLLPLIGLPVHEFNRRVDLGVPPSSLDGIRRKYGFCSFHSQIGAHAYVLSRRSTLWVVFRPTDSLRNWLSNAHTKMVPMPLDQKKTPPHVHSGFLNLYLSIRKSITSCVRDRLHENKQQIRNVVFTGMSLGGALAVLCAVDLKSQLDLQLSISLVTFGAPIVGCHVMAQSIIPSIGSVSLYGNKRDPIPTFPKAWMSWCRRVRYCAASLKPMSDVFEKRCPRHESYFGVDFLSDSLHCLFLF